MRKRRIPVFRLIFALFTLAAAIMWPTEDDTPDAQ